MYTRELENELQLRWNKIQLQMKSLNVDACVLTSAVNMFYTAGRVFSGYVYLPADGNPKFFVRRPKGLTKGDIYYIRKPEEIIAVLEESHDLPHRIALEADLLAYNDYVRLSSLFKDAEFVNANSLMREVRMIKTDFEISLLRESGIKHDAVYSHIPGWFEEGMSDIEVSIEVENCARKLGNLGIFRIFGSSMEIYMGSILVGDNADCPSPYDFALGGEGMSRSLPVGANGSMLRPGQTMMIDMNGNFTGYTTDMSRTYTIGHLDNELAHRAHRASIEITEMFKTYCRPGMAVAELYTKAMDMVKHRQLEDYFMGYTQQAGFIGHGVGIEINELPVIAPRSKHVIAENMVFALEPKFVIPGVGAVGVENTFVVKTDHLEQLTNTEEDIIEL